MKVRNHKCFKTPQGFDDLRPVNIIIGRNNAGKSALLDALDFAVDVKRQSFPENLELEHSIVLSSQDIDAAFSSATSGGQLPGASHNAYGRKYVGKQMFWATNKRELRVTTAPDGRQLDNWNHIAQVALQKRSAARLYRVGAARDVRPEPQRSLTDSRWQETGDGVTNLLVNYLNVGSLPTDLVTEALLDALNRIFTPEHFKSISTQQNDQLTTWQINLAEKGKGQIALSDSGAGLKTILIVLALCQLRVVYDKAPLSECIFALEELENNLHPTLLRRLLLYLREMAVSHGVQLFITTHSSVAIDVFATDPEAQLAHVENDGSVATVRSISTHSSRGHVLDDLGVRASDLLQSNCIVWVEGPTDRRYFNRWMDLWSDGELREGAHYQCVLYGGRLLSHFTAQEDADALNDLINMIAVNRNVIVLMDSDKRSEEAPLGDTKLRIAAEVETRGIAWITAGREIENYIPEPVLAGLGVTFGAESVGEFCEFGEIIASSPELQRVWHNGRGKVALADEICPRLDKISLGQRLDLGERLDAVCSKIREWNGISPR